ncbi:subtilisin-like protein [Polychaeton citri CBS 116435]|uniref:Subtilisin-like protein n=1 Tax=Polychaeton citri CBS 116435 TaxID=1314669 RepID=A0A9P4ULQ1_9PEZI|nr:subtilisin-like protein [Polychaeton citri CBS 116435]
MRFDSLALFAAVLPAALAAPATNHVLHEKRAHSTSWEKRDRLHGDVKLPMRIGLTQQNIDFGHEFLMDVAHPDSPSYGRHYTAEQVTDLFAPSADTVQMVKSWLEDAGIAVDRITQSVNKQWLQFDAKTSEVEELLKTKYHFYEHSRSGSSSIACDEYHVPRHVQEHIDYITPGIKLFASKVSRQPEGEIKKRTTLVHSSGSLGRTPPPTKALPIALSSIKPLSLALCDVAMTPDCIAALYNITQNKKSVPGNDLGIFEDLGDVYSQTDLDLFFITLQSRIPVGTHPVLDLIDGAVAPVPVTSAGVESALDFQISYPIIWPQNSVLYQTDDPVYEANYTYEGFLNNFLDAIDGSYCSEISPLDPQYPDPQSGGYKGKLQCGVYKPTNVISISYGGAEADLPISYQRRQCNEFMKLGLQGVSVCVSSGDSGVAGAAGDPGPNGCLGDKGQIFAPDFPSSCPYLTTLGATYLPPGADVTKDEEVAVTRFPSGGGFSNIYAQPDYQQNQVASYLANHNPGYPSYASYNNDSFGADGGIYNRAGRGYPDFSAIGDNVLIFGQGAPLLIGGTSASSPAFASVLTRINQERLLAGKSTVGFVNPTLYAHPEVLHDITVGNNSGCGTPGFYAAPGWDPVTGLGTPNYPKMLKLFMGLP